MSRLGRAVLIFTFSTMAAWAVLIAALLWLPAIGTPSGDALRHSLEGQTGGYSLGDLYGCERRAEGIRVCEVLDAGGSGSVSYRVRMDGRCWLAHKTSSEKYEEPPPLERRVSGCVEFRDQARLFERAFEAD